MPTALEPPEMAHGGYWYVVDVRSAEEEPDVNRPDVDFNGLCAWYGAKYCVIRTPGPLESVSTVSANTSVVLEEAVGVGSKRPYARIGGR